MDVEQKIEQNGSHVDPIDNKNVEYGGEEEKELERSLVRKLDRRMSILVLIYILNCTCFYQFRRALWS